MLQPDDSGRSGAGRRILPLGKQLLEGIVMILRIPDPSVGGVDDPVRVPLAAGIVAVRLPVGDSLSGGQLFLVVSEVINLGVEMGIIEKSGSWYSYNGEKIGQGSDAVRAYLQANPELDELITKQIKEKMFKKEDEA